MNHLVEILTSNLIFSNYVTKADIKNTLHVDISSFALKTNLANLKSEIDKSDIEKLVPVPVDLSKFPANICWSSRRLEDVFNTSSV